MATRLVLHIGSMKSGTSYLQNVLLHNRTLFREQGVDFPGRRWRDQVSSVMDLIERGGPQQPPLDPDGPWRRLVREIDAWPGTSVVSMEFLGPRGRPKIDVVLESFPETAVDVVLTARDLTRQLPAMWQEAVQNTSKVTWPEYVASVRRPADGPGPGRNFWKQQAVDQVAERWRDAVGDDHFTLVTVPPPGSPPGLLWERFASVVGVAPDLADLDVPRTNPSIGTPSAMVMRDLNEQLVGSELSRDAYMSVVKGLLAKRHLVRRDEPKLGADDRWLRRRARDQVAALRAMDLRVVGDLDDLLPHRVEGVHTRDVSAEDRLAAAVDGLAFMVREVVRRQEEHARLRTELARLRAQLRAVEAVPTPGADDTTTGQVG